MVTVDHPGELCLDVLPRTVLKTGQRPQNRADGDRPTTLTLRLFLNDPTIDFTAGDGALPVYMHHADVEVHFGPLEARELATPHPAHNGQRPRRVQPVASCAGEECAALTSRPHALATPFGPVGRARLPDSLDDHAEILQRLGKRAVNVPDRVRGQGPAIASAACQQVSVELVDSALVQCVQLARPEERDDVLCDGIAVVGQRRHSEVQLALT